MLSQPLEGNTSLTRKEKQKVKKKKVKNQEAVALGVEESIKEVADFTDESVSMKSLV